jgi:hypothetical protein
VEPDSRARPGVRVDHAPFLPDQRRVGASSTSIVDGAPHPRQTRTIGVSSTLGPRCASLCYGSDEIDVHGLGRLQVDYLKPEAISQALGHEGAMTGLGRGLDAE